MTENKEVSNQEENNSVDNSTLDDVFDNQPETSEAEESTQEPQQEDQSESKEEEKSESKSEEKKEDSEEEKKDEKSDDSVTEGDKDEKGETPTPEDDQSWTKTAVIDERRKRQELEKKTKELQEELLQLKTPKGENKEEKVDRPDVLDDPEGAFNYTEQTFEDKLFKQKVTLTQQIMRDKYNDYDEKEGKFMELAKNNILLQQQLRESDNPAKFAYETANAQIESERFKDPDYLTALREDIKKEVLTELAQSQKIGSGDKSEVVVPPNLTNKASIDSNITQKEDYKGSLDEIFES